MSVMTVCTTCGCVMDGDHSCRQAVSAMAAHARYEQERSSARIAWLESQLAGLCGAFAGLIAAHERSVSALDCSDSRREAIRSECEIAREALADARTPCDGSCGERHLKGSR